MTKLYTYLTISFITLFLIVNSLFTVGQHQTSIVFQFGEAIRTVVEPGLHLKIPFIQKVEFFDKRLLHAEAEAKELTASDGKRIIVDAFAKFHIVHPITFYKTVHDNAGVNIRLNRILESAMRKAIGKVPLTTLLTGERSKIMLSICEQVNEEAQNFGIHVVDVRILRADLPSENSAAIYRRMQTEREKEAKQIRAEGKEESERIRSRADKESQIIIAESYKTSQISKGEGDATAAKIYNEAFSQDPEFYRYYQTLLTYRNSLNAETTSYILSTNAEFFKFLNLQK